MQVLSRIPESDFFDREAELARLHALACRRETFAAANRPAAPDEPGIIKPPRRHANALLLGAPRSGKSELLRKTFDCLFAEPTDCVPIYLGLRADGLEPRRFASDYLSQFLAQFIAFRRRDPRLMALADEPLASIAQNAPPDDYLWVRGIIEAFTRVQDSYQGDAYAGANDLRRLLRCALAAPALAATRAQCAPYVMVDNAHLLAADGAQIGASATLRAEFIRAFSLGGSALPPVTEFAPVYVLSGLRRLVSEILPPEEGVYESLELIRVEAMADEPMERLIRATAARLGVELSDSTAELMIQQLGGDLFYTRALLAAAAADGARLRSFMEFERLYTNEVLQGRISHYLNAVLREVAPDTRSRRAALEALILVVEASSPIPVEAVAERAATFTPDAEALLTRLHSRELLEMSYGFVSASADTVLADFVRAKYRTEIAGARPPVAGEELLGEKLKDSYRLMMTRYNRSVEQQLVDLLSRFDFQAVPTSLLDVGTFDKQYRGSSRAQARQSLEEEGDRLRLPQIVLVNDMGGCEIQGSNCRLYLAGGFEGGIYSDANEALWVIALVNAKEPLGIEAVREIERRMHMAARNPIFGSLSDAIRWLISKEGFTEAAAEQLRAGGARQSTYTQLDLLYDYLLKIAPKGGESRPASEVELVIPIEDEAELIAARTVEQIARAADFDKESINQIKTALIEACINAAEHSDSPDKKIYHRFAVIDDRLVISVTNKGKVFDGVVASRDQNGGGSLGGTRGRGLKIIRGLMDDVRFEHNDEGTTLVMTKLLKRTDKQ